MQMLLSEGVPGRRYKVRSIKGESLTLMRRMVDMGVVPGSVVEVERVAPLGDPVEVLVRGYHLSLRREEASAVEVEEVG